jgi:hypothetical protein
MDPLDVCFGFRIRNWRVAREDGVSFFTIPALHSAGSALAGYELSWRRIAMATAGLPFVRRRVAVGGGTRELRSFDARAFARLALDFDPDAHPAFDDELGGPAAASLERLMEALGESVVAPEKADGWIDAAGNVAEAAADIDDSGGPGDTFDRLLRESDQQKGVIANLNKELVQLRGRIEYYKTQLATCREQRKEAKRKEEEDAYTGKRYLKMRGEFELALRRNKGYGSAVNCIELLSEKTKNGKLHKDALIRAEYRLGDAMRFHARESRIRDTNALAAVQEGLVWSIDLCKTDATHSELVDGDKTQVTTLRSRSSTGAHRYEVLDCQKVRRSTALELFSILKKQMHGSGAALWNERLEMRLGPCRRGTASMHSCSGAIGAPRSISLATTSWPRLSTRVSRLSGGIVTSTRPSSSTRSSRARKALTLTRLGGSSGSAC